MPACQFPLSPIYPDIIGNLLGERICSIVSPLIPAPTLEEPQREKTQDSIRANKTERRERGRKGSKPLTNSSNGMPRRQKRKTTRIHHPQIADPPHPRPRIQHRARVAAVPHLTRAAGVEDGTEALSDEGQDLRIRRDARARAGEVFPANEEGTHGLGLEEGAGAFVAGDGDGLVGGVCEPVWVDDGGVPGVGGGDGDGAAREGRDEDGGDGGVVVAVGGGIEDVVFLVTVVGGGGDIFELGPVRGEGGKVGEGGLGEVGAQLFGDLFEGEEVCAAVGEHALRRRGVELGCCLGGEGGVGEGGGGEHVHAVGGPAQDVVPHVLTHA